MDVITFLSLQTVRYCRYPFNKPRAYRIMRSIPLDLFRHCNRAELRHDRLIIPLLVAVTFPHTRAAVTCRESDHESYRTSKKKTYALYATISDSLCGVKVAENTADFNEDRTYSAEIERNKHV